MKITIEIEIPDHGHIHTSSDARDVEKLLIKIGDEAQRILKALESPKPKEATQ